MAPLPSVASRSSQGWKCDVVHGCLATVHKENGSSRNLCSARSFLPYFSDKGVLKHRRLAICAVAASTSPGDSKKLKGSSDKSKQQQQAETRANNLKEVVAVSPEEDDEYDEEVRTVFQARCEDLMESVEAAMDYVPGPRVGRSALPWLVAVPLGYLSITFVIAVVRNWYKFNSPMERRRRLVGKNAFLCETVDSYFPDRKDELTGEALRSLGKRCDNEVPAVVRKYIRYALNEKPFNPETVGNLLHLRKVSALTDDEMVNEVNEIAKRIVKSKGPVVMNTEGMTEKGIKRKAAVQALFSKLYYLSEIEEFISEEARGKLQLKETFGVTSEDVNVIRIETLTAVSDLDILDKNLESGNVSDEE